MRIKTMISAIIGQGTKTEIDVPFTASVPEPATYRKRARAGSLVTIVDRVYQTEATGRFIQDSCHEAHPPQDNANGLWTILLEDGRRYRNNGILIIH